MTSWLNAIRTLLRSSVPATPKACAGAACSTTTAAADGSSTSAPATVRSSSPSPPRSADARSASRTAGTTPFGNCAAPPARRFAASSRTLPVFRSATPVSQPSVVSRQSSICTGRATSPRRSPGSQPAAACCWSRRRHGFATPCVPILTSTSAVFCYCRPLCSAGSRRGGDSRVPITTSTRSTRRRGNCIVFFGASPCARFSAAHARRGAGSGMQSSISAPPPTASHSRRALAFGLPH